MKRTASRLVRVVAKRLARILRSQRERWTIATNWLWAAWFTLVFVDEWDRFPAVTFRWPVRMRIHIRKAPGAKLILRGRIVLASFLEVRQPTGIVLWRNSCLTIEDDFIISDGVRISLDPHAELTIAGGIRPGAWGIHSHSIVMVRKRIVLGRHSGISFHSWITDSDWHSIGGRSDQDDVIIGDRVWVGGYTRILKGARIADDSIVATSATVLAGDYPPRSVLAGVPARVVRTDIETWA